METLFNYYRIFYFLEYILKLKIMNFNNKKILKEDTNFYFKLIKIFGEKKNTRNNRIR